MYQDRCALPPHSGTQADPRPPRRYSQRCLGSMSFMGASRRRRRPAGPWAPPDAGHGTARHEDAARPRLCRAAAPRPPPTHWRRAGPAHAAAGLCPGAAAALAGTGGPRSARPGRHRRGGTPAAREPGGRQPRPGGDLQGRTRGRLTAGPMATPARPGRGSAARRGPPRSAAALSPPRSSLTWPVPPARVHPPAQPAFLGRGAVAERRQLRAEQQRVRRLLAAAVAQRLARGVEAVLQQPAEQRAGGGGRWRPRRGGGLGTERLPHGGRPLPFVSRLSSGWARWSLRSCRRPCPQLRALGMRRPPPAAGSARRRRPARSALQRGGRRPPPGTRRRPPASPTPG